jgi:diaminohydroxyphosphoribosylaminopyrimidine deaminase/5-amino-6-(5-phosphoribosylamino)uracil reductase
MDSLPRDEIDLIPMASDEGYMRRVIDLARAGIGLASPNPAVGAVIMNSSGTEIGAGTHTYDGVKHAEVIALEQAGTRARGSTLYVNLEPCSHQGRTGPCADAIIAAGIGRVVCCMQDPNPKVAGAGFARLRAAGIEVEVGLLAAEARKLNESFARYIRSGRPLVTLKSAMTLDGKIAPPRQSSDKWITGEAARAHVQQLRHRHDAILAGVGTVIADDPLLTDRSGLPRRRALLRVILDSHLRTPLGSRVIETANNDVLIAYSSADEQARKALGDRGVCLERISPDSNGRPDFHALIHRLAETEITSLMVEGGSHVNSTVLRSGAVDKIFLYYAPKVLGDGAVPFLSDELTRHSGLALAVREFALHRFEDDFAVEGYLADPYSD